MARFTEEYIRKSLKEYWDEVDYKVGDWVETCNLLPGIVQEIEIRYDREQEYFVEETRIFYPHMAFDEKHEHKYHGGSCCSVHHCGVHKITPEYACKLMSLGEERLKKLWEKGCKMTPKGEAMKWEKLVEDEYDKVFKEEG